MAKKKSVKIKKVLCKKTCLAKNMGLGYCVAGQLYPVPGNTKISHHFEELKSPLEEMAEAKKTEEKPKEEEKPAEGTE